MTPVLALRRADFVRLFASRFHVGGVPSPLASEPLGPYLTECPACFVDDRSDKVVASLTSFMNHVIRHLRRLVHVPGEGLMTIPEMIAMHDQVERDAAIARDLYGGVHS